MDPHHVEAELGHPVCLASHELARGGEDGVRNEVAAPEPDRGAVFENQRVAIDLDRPVQAGGPFLFIEE